MPQTPGVYLGLFPDNNCIYDTDCKEGYVLRELQQGFCVIETWRECWNIKIINEDKTQATHLSHRLRPPEAYLTLKGWNISFVNNIKYLNVIFNKRITWRLHIEMVEAKAFRTFIMNYSLFKTECLRTNIKLTLHKAPIRSVMIYAYHDCKTMFSAPPEIFQGARQSAICTRFSTFCTHTTI
jgi:hypothetical protein